MHTQGSISQHNTILPDMDKRSCKDLGDEHIFFNVHKKYTGLESFTFESTLQIKCGDAFGLKVEQTLQSTYHFKDNSLGSDHFKEIIEKLFSDSITSLQEYIENTTRMAKRKMPAITVTPNVLSNYLSSMNYKDLYQSCFA